MKIRKQELKQVIREELLKTIKEQDRERQPQPNKKTIVFQREYNAGMQEGAAEAQSQIATLSGQLKQIKASHNAKPSLQYPGVRMGPIKKVFGPFFSNIKTRQKHIYIQELETPIQDANEWGKAMGWAKVVNEFATNQVNHLSNVQRTASTPRFFNFWKRIFYRLLQVQTQQGMQKGSRHMKAHMQKLKES
jgi:hypothetical protein